MKTRSAWRVLPALMLLACGALGADAAPVNVVLIVVDLGWMDTSVYGSSFYETPHIDQLAADGTRFVQFSAAGPVCSPTRASLLSGEHPARLQLTNWIGGQKHGPSGQAQSIKALPRDEVTLGEAFAPAGYSTGYVGKWHLGAAGFLPSDQGFRFSFAVNDCGQPGSYFPPDSSAAMPEADVPDLESDADGAYLTDRLTDASVAFIERTQGRPLLLVLSHYAVRTPMMAPAAAVQRHEARAAALGPRAAPAYEAEHDAEHDAETRCSKTIPPTPPWSRASIAAWAASWPRWPSCNWTSAPWWPSPRTTVA